MSSRSVYAYLALSSCVTTHVCVFFWWCVCIISALTSNWCLDIIFGKFILMHVGTNIFPCLHWVSIQFYKMLPIHKITLIISSERFFLVVNHWKKRNRNFFFLFHSLFHLLQKIYSILYIRLSGKLIASIKQAEKCIQIRFFVCLHLLLLPFYLFCCQKLCEKMTRA